MKILIQWEASIISQRHHHHQQQQQQQQQNNNYGDDNEKDWLYQQIINQYDVYLKYV